MEYTKDQLLEEVNITVDREYSPDVHLPSLVEDAAVVLFMKGKKNAIIKQAVCDLYNLGSFQFKGKV